MDSMDKETGRLGTMSEDFLKVVERIQKRLSGIPRSLEVSHLQQIEDAERVVDSCALDLQNGRVEPREWQAALTFYEDAWLVITETLGERRN